MSPSARYSANINPAKQTPKSAKNVAVKTGKSYSAPTKTVAKKTAKK